MSANWTRRFVDFLLLIVALAALAAIVQAASSIADGEFHVVSYAAQSDDTTTQVLASTGNADSFWELREGTIRVENLTWLNAARLAGRLVGLGLLAAVFWHVRGTLGRIGRGDVFGEDNIVAMRRIGKFLVAGSVVSIAMTVMTQYAILDAIPELPGRAIHPSISWSEQGVENIWMDYTPPLLPMLLAMIAFITAGAFRSGQQYREDSESVV